MKFSLKPLFLIAGLELGGALLVWAIAAHAKKASGTALPGTMVNLTQGQVYSIFFFVPAGHPISLGATGWAPLTPPGVKLMGHSSGENTPYDDYVMIAKWVGPSGNYARVDAKVAGGTDSPNLMSLIVADDGVATTTRITS